MCTVIENLIKLGKANLFIVMASLVVNVIEFLCESVYLYNTETVCVCVCERERERERESVYVHVCTSVSV